MIKNEPSKDERQARKTRAAAFSSSKKQSTSESAYQFADNRPEAVAQRKVQEMADNYINNQSVQMSESGAGSSDLESGETIQRSIGYHPTAAAAGQFQIDNVRPGWTGAAAAMALGANQDRAHIIAFEVIQNDLANILNAMMAARGTPAFGAQNARLTNLCNSLFVTAGPEMVTMNARRAALSALINGTAAGLPPAAARANLTTNAGNLLSSLNSCVDNLRPGNSGLNQSIGYSIDADFQAGSFWYHGPIYSTGALPPVGAPGGAAVVLGPGAGAPVPANSVMAGPFRCVRLTAAHESKVYRYQQSATIPLSFVTSGTNGGALYPGTAAGQQLSSTQMPTVANNPPIPVCVIDPAGANPPFVYT